MDLSVDHTLNTSFPATDVVPPRNALDSINDFDSKLFKSNSLNAIQYCPTSNAINVPLTDEEIRKVKVFDVLPLSMITTKALKQVFSYLNVKDILTVSRICNVWNLIAMHSLSWNKVDVRHFGIEDWNNCIDMLNSQHTVSLSTDHMLLHENNDKLKEFWINYARGIQRAIQLRVLKICEPPTIEINDIIGSLFQLEIFHISRLMFQYKINDGKTFMSQLALNMNELQFMDNHKKLKLKGIESSYPSLMPSFSNLTNLKSLELTSIDRFPDTVFSLNTLPSGLESLVIGNCYNLPKNFGDLIKILVNLKSLRLENFVSKCSYQWQLEFHDIFTSIGDHPKLKVLELVNVTLCPCIENSVRQWNGLKALLIGSADNNTSLCTKRIMKKVEKLFKTLTNFIYCIKIIHLPVIEELLRKSLVLESPISNETDHFVTVICFPGPPKIEGIMPIDNIFTEADSVEKLTSMLRNIFGTTYTIVIKASLDTASSIFITDHFDDIM